MLKPKPLTSLCRWPNAVVETVKWAEDGNGLIGYRGQVRMRTGSNPGSTGRTILRQENQGALTPDRNTLSLFVRPHDIVI